MGTDLETIKAEFKPRLPALADLLSPYRIPPASFQAGAIAYFESNTILKYCDPQSVLNAIVTFAVQGIHLDPGSGHACIVPFSGKAQPITMVKGYTVLAARGGYTLQARLVREGDKVREIGGSDPRIEHEPVLGGKGKIIGTYAVARSKQLPTLFTPFITIDDVIATRDRSKGFQKAKADGKSHPWISDFDAMALKTGKRLLAKDIPNDMLGAAAWLDTQHDLGHVAYLRPDGTGAIDAEVTPYPERQPENDKPIDLTKPSWIWIMGDGQPFDLVDETKWLGGVLRRLEAAKDPTTLRAALERNTDTMAALEKAGFGESVARVRAAFAHKLGERSTVPEVGEEPPMSPPPPPPPPAAAQDGAAGFWAGPSIEIVPTVPAGKRLPDWPAWDAAMRQRAGEAPSRVDLDRLNAANAKHMTSFTLAQPRSAAALTLVLTEAASRLGAAA